LFNFFYIPRLLAVFMDDNAIWMALEYIEYDLLRYMELRQKPLSLPLILVRSLLSLAQLFSSLLFSSLLFSVDSCSTVHHSAVAQCRGRLPHGRNHASVRVGAPACSAAAASSHILTRASRSDIKPMNVLLGASGQVRLADFGLALPLGERGDQACHTPSDVVTLWYRPPEVLLGFVDYGPASDLWR
jgi:serine/threonine protein kinase